LVQVVKLSDAVQPLPRQTTEFVHGVPHSFLEVGDQKAKQPEDGQPRFSKGAYFIGKVSFSMEPLTNHGIIRKRVSN
jgi:digalactosyldiacylglycerol synthase